MLSEAVDRAVEVGSVAGRAARPRGVFERLPDLAGAATAGFSIPAMVLLLAGFYRIPLVILLGCCGAVATVVAVVRDDPEPALPRDRLWTLAALAVSLAFLIGNAGYSAQRVDTAGPAGVHALTGQWLVHHHALAVPLRGEVFGAAGDAVSGDSSGVTPDAPGFRVAPERPGVALPAGSHLLPALLGVTGWIAGPVGLFGTGALIGALALFALFGLVRRFAGRGFALLASAALGVSMPMVASGRDTQTEPLLLLLLAGGLSVLCRAVRTRRPAQFLVAGLTGGAAVTVGAGGFAAALVLLAAAVALLATAAPGERGGWLRRCGLLSAGAAVPAGIGYLDLVRLAGDSYRGSHDHLVRLAGATGVAVVVGAVVVVAAWAVPARWLAPGANWRRPAARSVAAAVVLVFAVLASRPFWLAGNAGHTLSWVAWYYGWPMVVGSVLGLAAGAHRLVRRGDPRLLGPVAMVAAVMVWRLVDPDVAVGQVAAMRQFLPVLLPVLLAAAGYLLYRLAGRGRRYRYLSVGLGLVLVGVPAYVTAPLGRLRPAVPRLAGVRAVCEALPDDAAVVSIGLPAVDLYTQAMRSFCNVPSYAIASLPVGPQGSADLRRVRAEVVRHHRRLYVLAASARAFPTGSAGPMTDPLFTVRARVWPRRRDGAPHLPVTRTAGVLLGMVGPDGTPVPVPAVPVPANP